MKNKFICVQIFLEREIQTIDNNSTSITNMWGDIVRIVEAETEEEAIGKFIVQTRYVKAKEKLNVNCYKLEHLKTIE